jgi:outer membrane lipoprotein carrier protein
LTRNRASLSIPDVNRVVHPRSRGRNIRNRKDRKILTRLAVLAWFVFLLAAPVGAANVETLTAYLRATTSASARFTQVVFDRSGRKLQETSGSMQFARPGRIRWTYEKPYEQLIVGDGSKLWVYDKDLNQVTVRSIAQGIGGSPAALLAGSNDIEKDFRLSATGTQDGLDWLEAAPRGTESTFQKVRMGFGKSGLEAMELADGFGQITIVRFTAIERNPKLAAALFQFTPPQGVDIISD